MQSLADREEWGGAGCSSAGAVSGARGAKRKEEQGVKRRKGDGRCKRERKRSKEQRARQKEK